MIEHISSTQVFKNMHPKKQQIIRELDNATKGKSMQQAMPVLMLTIKKMKEEHLSFTEKEVNCLIAAFSENMNDKEKKQLEMIKRYFS